MESFPVKLLQLIFQAIIDDWPFIPWADPSVLCSACTAASLPVFTRFSDGCNAPSIHVADGGAPRNACQTMRLGWLNLTFVCSMWRNILIDTPDLWTNISSYMTSDCVRAFCARSGDKPVHLTWSTYVRVDPEAMILALQSTHARVNQLVISDDVLEYYSAHFHASPMHHLRSLTLHNHVYVGPRTDLLAPLQAQNLQELILSTFPSVDVWSFFQSTALRKLSLNLDGGDGTGSDMLQGLLDSLRLRSTLEELHLSGLTNLNGFAIEREDLDLVKPVQMDRCTSLELSGDQSVVDNLIGILALPPLTRIKLFGTLNYHDPDEPSVSGTHRALTRANNPNLKPFASFTFDIDASNRGAPTYRETWKLQISRAGLSERSSLSNGDFTVVWDDLGASIISGIFSRAALALSDICASLAPSVRELCLIQSTATPSVDSPQVYYDCFASWGPVERLRVIGTAAAHSMVDGLLSCRVNDDQPVFYRLRALELIDVDWEGSGTEDSLDDALGMKIVRALQQRREAGAELETLVVHVVEALQGSSGWEALQGTVMRVERAH